MMKTISKYQLSVARQALSIPAGAQILCLQTQDDNAHIWALVDTDQELCSRNFEIYGTGHKLPDNPGTYIGTFQTNSGLFVWHVFESHFKITETNEGE
jgi:hypothetical protein